MLRWWCLGMRRSHDEHGFPVKDLATKVTKALLDYNDPWADTYELFWKIAEDAEHEATRILGDEVVGPTQLRLSPMWPVAATWTWSGTYEDFSELPRNHQKHLLRGVETVEFIFHAEVVVPPEPKRGRRKSKAAKEVFDEEPVQDLAGVSGVRPRHHTRGFRPLAEPTTP